MCAACQQKREATATTSTRIHRAAGPCAATFGAALCCCFLPIQLSDGACAQERNLGAGAAGMTADEMMDYRGKGNGVFIRATETPHSAAPNPAMLEKCTVAKWSQRAPAASL